MPFPNLDGRPSKYSDDILNKIPEYVLECVKKDELPTRAGLAVYIGISKVTLCSWEDNHEQLLNALKKMDALQENQVWQRALKGDYNSNIAKLLLANHGYSDKSENTQNVNVNYRDLPDDKLEELIKSKQGG